MAPSESSTDQSAIGLESVVTLHRLSCSKDGRAMSFEAVRADVVNSSESTPISEKYCISRAEVICAISTCLAAPSAVSGTPLYRNRCTPYRDPGGIVRVIPPTKAIAHAL